MRIAGNLYEDRLRYETFQTSWINAVELAAQQLRNVEAKRFDFMNYRDPYATAWAALHGAELLRLFVPEHEGYERRMSIRRSLALAVHHGRTHREISRELCERYAFAELDALTIARTEVQLAAGHGSYCGAVAVGMKVKRWHLSNDDGVCERCSANAGQGWIPIGERFASGALAPLDHVGCRCDVTYRRVPSG